MLWDSKALMEKVMLSKSRNVGRKGTIFIATRYGNVLGSRGFGFTFIC